MTVAKKIAMHDISTGLPNINMLEKELDKAISLVGYEQQLVCVAFEVNELEDINYLFGSDQADNVIKSLSTNIEYSLDKGTFFSRISESEFFVFFPHLMKKSL